MNVSSASASRDTAPFRPRFDIGATRIDCGIEPRVDSYDAAEDAVSWPLFDYSDCEPTLDQAAINQWLSQTDWSGKDLLHVGAGNSSVAKLAAGKARSVVSLTVAGNEFNYARSLNLPAYSVHLLNKYGEPFTQAFEAESFDCILDNNLASFACCQRHFERYFEALIRLLKRDGVIVTHWLGMQWTLDVGVDDVEAAWQLDEAKLRLIAGSFGLTVRREEDLFFLSRSQG